MKRAARHVRRKLELLAKDEPPLTAADWQRLSFEFATLARIAEAQREIIERVLGDG